MKEDVKKEIGRRLNQFRVAIDSTQADIAGNIDFSRSNFSKIESGVILPNARLLIKLATHYNLSTNWLLTGKGDMFAGTPPKSSIADLYPNLPTPEVWDRLMSSMVKDPDQALIRLHELKKQEYIDCKTFLEMGYDTLRNREELIRVYEKRYGEFKGETVKPD